jgi:glutathione S-transferase
MALVFHERVGLEGRRISPFSWRIRYALAHKQLQPAVVPTRFADVDRIRTLSGQHMVPILEDGATVVHDSWAIACYLEDRFPDAPSLFGGAVGRGATRVVNLWADRVLGAALRRQIYADFVACIDPGDRGYFRSSREAQLGATLEDYSAARDAHLPALIAACAPLEQALTEQAFLAGEAPAYVDHAVFSLFQWARVGSPRDVLAGQPDVAALRAWRARMVAAYGGLGDRFALYPPQQGVPA